MSDTSTASGGGSDRSLLAMMDEAQHRLQHLELSCRQILSPPASKRPVEAPNDPKVLQLQLAKLQTQLLVALDRREDQDVAFRQATQYATAKGSSNGVLHALFDQASAGKVAVLSTYLDTGSIPTRDGLRHWKLDIRTVRNEAGASLLHVAVGVSTAREKLKVKLVHLLVDRAGFDPNVRDVFGQTPLHIAAMGGFQEVVEALLERGADPTAQDRSGLTPLSLVRTLSRPPAEVVQTLVQAESAAMRNICSRSESIPLSKAVASALFLKELSRFVLEQHLSAFTRQTTALLNALLEGTDEFTVPFDRILLECVSMLFDVVPDPQIVRLDTVFSTTLYWDPEFTTNLKIEADGYGLSLISGNSGIFAGLTWTGILLKLIQNLKVELADLDQAEIQEDDAMNDTPTVLRNNGGVETKEAGVQASPAVPPHKWSTSSIATTLSVSPRTTLYYADQSIIVAKTRQVWHYAVLLRGSTQAFPGMLALKPESDIATASEDVSKCFPLEDRLSIGSSEYIAIDYNEQTREIRLDRKYDGKEAATVKAYLTGACSSWLPPYIAVKRIWEREPGNKYEDQTSNEQELFQDYQFLDPESDYEVAIKLGPIPSGKEARSIVAEWRQSAKELFDSKKCMSRLAACQHYCPQRDGRYLCLGTMAALGQGLAKSRLGRPTFSKPLKSRASLQRLQDRFKGTDEWPGSPSNVRESPP